MSAPSLARTAEAYAILTDVLSRLLPADGGADVENPGPASCPREPRECTGARGPQAGVPAVALLSAGSVIGVVSFAHGLGLSNFVGLPLVIVATFAVGLIAVSRRASDRSVAVRSRLLVGLVLAVHCAGLVALVLPRFLQSPPFVGLTGTLGLLILMSYGTQVVLARTDGSSGVLLGLGFLVLGVAWIAATPDATIDVLVYQRLGAERLLAGINPYAPGYPDIYPPELSQRFFAAGLSQGGVLQFGFPYPGLSLGLATIGGLLGDVRFAHVASLALAGGLLHGLSRGSGEISRSAAVLLITSPMCLHVVTFGWTEPLLVLAVLLWFRYGTGSVEVGGLLLGLVMGVKQYTLLLAVPLLGRPRRPHGFTYASKALLGILVATATSVPFLIWDLRHYFRSVVTLHFLQPLRTDALSIPGVLARMGLQLTGLPGLAFTASATLLALVLVLVRDDGRPYRRAAGMTFVALVFFLASKQAFVNYYLVTVAGSFTSLALWTSAERGVQVRKRDARSSSLGPAMPA